MFLNIIFASKKISASNKMHLIDLKGVERVHNTNDNVRKVSGKRWY